MNIEEFNDKWDDYLEDGHYGLDIVNEDVVEFLDELFSNVLIHVPGFKFSQIKQKFNDVRFYSNLPLRTRRMIAREIKLILEK